MLFILMMSVSNHFIQKAEDLEVIISCVYQNVFSSVKLLKKKKASVATHLKLELITVYPP